MTQAQSQAQTPEALRLADACLDDWDLVRPHLVVDMLRTQLANIAQLEAELLSKSKQLNASGLLITGLEGRLASLQQQAAAAKEAVATLQSERDANAILTAELAQLRQAGAPDWIETLTQNWDGCMYDAPGEMIDIGASIREAASRATSPTSPTPPAQASKPVPLTHEQLVALYCAMYGREPEPIDEFTDVCRRVEAAHGIGASNA